MRILQLGGRVEICYLYDVYDANVLQTVSMLYGNMLLSCYIP